MCSGDYFLMRVLRIDAIDANNPSLPSYTTFPDKYDRVASDWYGQRYTRTEVGWRTLLHTDRGVVATLGVRREISATAKHTSRSAGPPVSSCLPHSLTMAQTNPYSEAGLGLVDGASNAGDVREELEQQQGIQESSKTGHPAKGSNKLLKLILVTLLAIAAAAGSGYGGYRFVQSRRGGSAEAADVEGPPEAEQKAAPQGPPPFYPDEVDKQQ
ncbi:hypothetical protein Efla_002731 [Eimeria flavescens]